MTESVDWESQPYKCSKLIFCLGASRQSCGCEPLEEGPQEQYAVVYHVDSSKLVIIVLDMFSLLSRASFLTKVGQVVVQVDLLQPLQRIKVTNPARMQEGRGESGMFSTT